MRSKAAIAAALTGVLALGACSWFSSDSEASKAGDAAKGPVYTPVESVRDVEIGRTRDGFVITAYGIAPGLGYSSPELRPRRQGTPAPDGFLDYDFVARAPDPGFNLGTGDAKARTVRADLLVKAKDLRGAQGIRVHAVEGGLQMNF
jgi:hypothetical protein